LIFGELYVQFAELSVAGTRLVSVRRTDPNWRRRW